jgi:hypothetical protein
MQLLLVGGMHCSVLMLMLLEFRRPFNTISIYFYINFYNPHKSAPYFSRRLFLTCCNPREIAALSSFDVDWLLYMNVYEAVHRNPLLVSFRSYTSGILLQTIHT